MPANTPLKVLYIVSVNAPTSVPLEAAGKIAELCAAHNISFYTAAYYEQPDPALKTDFVQDLIELNCTKSYHLSSIRNFYRLIRKIQPHIIHVHHGVSAFQGALLAKVAGVGCVFKTEHNDHKFYKWYQKILTVPVFMLTDRIICNSNSTRLSYYPWEKMIAYSKSIYVYNGIDISDIAASATEVNRTIARKQLCLNDNDILFVSVGRLIQQKNYQRLITAMANACKINKHIKLLIVGGGSGEAQLRMLVKQYGVEQHIFLAGTVQRGQVYRFVSAADFFIIPSLWEGFCNSLVEAMAAGKPVLTSGIDTLREVAGDVAVAFFNPKSVTYMQDAICKAALMPQEERERFARAAKTRALEMFTLQKTAESYIHEYLKTDTCHEK